MKIVRDRQHRKFINSLPSCSSFHNPPSDAAHISIGSGRGIGIKASDELIVPLSHTEHLRQHQIGELSFWGDMLEDAQMLARNLYQVSGDWGQGVKLVLDFRRKYALHNKK